MTKPIILALASCLCATAFAAQCEGVTQSGERCKRDAAEGSAFCIGHADQAKQTAAAADNKQKDDGACWAVTAAGKRCKRKKDGESDYCRQHAPSVKPAKPVSQCRAMTYEGKQCVRKPVEGSRYCAQHGGK